MATRCRGAVLISPFTDFSIGGNSRFDNARHDPMLSPEGIKEMNALYLDDTAHAPSAGVAGVRRLPRPAARSWPRWAAPRSCSTTHAAWASAHANRAWTSRSRFGTQVPHVWHVWPFLPETQQAIRHIGEFVHEHLARPSPKERARVRKAPAKVAVKTSVKVAAKGAGEGAKRGSAKATPKKRSGDLTQPVAAASEPATT
jgi:hypothetical protein